MAVKVCVLFERVLSYKSWVAVLAAWGWSCAEVVWEGLEWAGVGGKGWVDCCWECRGVAAHVERACRGAEHGERACQAVCWERWGRC